ncbi:J domain-containing protein 1 [Apiospora marii]|uniref:J domain-containing protein 1 n=1 Tax=Apiospora marii TaxID=335849 RepID=A0ABR1RLF7_9PEZI
MGAIEYRANVESGEVPVDCHDRVLRIAFIYSDHGLWDGNGAFDVVDKLHARGWSFGPEDLRFNRTLDMFYIAQIAAGIYRSSDQCEGDFPSADDFDAFYVQHYPALHQDAWREYYSPTFLAQTSSARFYRLPNLRDLPDASDPLCQPRHKGKRPATSPSFPTGRTTSVHPYSETQARFWLKHFSLDSPNNPSCPSNSREAWNHNQASLEVAQGAIDVWAWEAHYSRERWEEAALVDDATFLEPDLDGTRPSEIWWCGWPDGAGVSMSARWRGWEPEMGSEEEIAFLAAVAAKETEGVENDDGDGLDYAVRSHILLAVMRVAELQMEPETEQHVGDLKRRMADAGRIDESRTETWVQQALVIIKPYVHRWRQGGYAAIAGQSELLRHILVENGQLFARWRLSPTSKEFDFTLKPRA